MIRSIYEFIKTINYHNIIVIYDDIVKAMHDDMKIKASNDDIKRASGIYYIIIIKGIYYFNKFKIE